MTRSEVISISWRTQAACKDADPGLFFSADGETFTQQARREKQAKAICADCPVRRACLDYAASKGEKDGIWGGLNKDELSRHTRSVRRRATRRNAPQENVA